MWFSLYIKKSCLSRFCVCLNCFEGSRHQDFVGVTSRSSLKVQFKTDCATISISPGHHHILKHTQPLFGILDHDLIFSFLTGWNKPIVDIPSTERGSQTGEISTSQTEIAFEPCDADCQAFCFREKARHALPYPVSFLPRCPFVLPPSTRKQIFKPIEKTLVQRVMASILSRFGSYLDGKLALGEVNSALLGLLQHAGLLIRG